MTIDGGPAGPIELSEDITVPACHGPDAPPDVTFTFTVKPSESRARVGDTIEYLYCGTNTSTIPLEVVRLVDDRLGVVIELPSVETVVAPGESICNTDVGVPVSYTVQPDDAGKVIYNNAVVTVRTQEDQPRQFQGTATSNVAVPLTRGAFGGNEDIRVCHRSDSKATRTTCSCTTRPASSVGATMLTPGRFGSPESRSGGATSSSRTRSPTDRQTRVTTGPQARRS